MLYMEEDAMLVERGLQLRNVDVVGDAYAIAANYLHRAGLMDSAWTTDNRLLEIIVGLFENGDRNKIRIANRAIMAYQKPGE